MYNSDDLLYSMNNEIRTYSDDTLRALNHTSRILTKRSLIKTILKIDQVIGYSEDRKNSGSIVTSVSLAEWI